MYNTILFPTDGSDVSKEASEEAFKIAEEFNAKVTILHVVNSTEVSGIGDYSNHMTALEEYGGNIVQEFEEIGEDYNVTTDTEILTGRPSTSIVKYAEANNYDLITIGTNSRSGVKRMLLGSTTEQVIRKTDTSVLTI